MDLDAATAAAARCVHSLKEMPGTVLLGTNQFILKNNKIRKLCKFFEHITDLQIIDFRNNNISSVCETFANKVREGRNATSPWNQLDEIWLSGNPFHCNCSMTWMVGWLNNFTTSNGEHVIVDYENFTCKSGMVIGKPIHLLNEVNMGCFPSKWTTWQKAGVGIGTSAAIIIFIITLVATKRSREVKFLLYYHFKLNTIPDDDKNVNLDNIKYDAFFCFWQVPAK